MTTLALNKQAKIAGSARELETFVRQAKRKLFEFRVLLAEKELSEGKIIRGDLRRLIKK